MRIFLVLLGIFCCSAANGFLFGNFGMPENFVFMIFPSIICAVILWFHRKMTASWTPSADPLADWSGYHFPVFRVLMFICFIAFILLVAMPTSYKSAKIVAMTTFLIASFIAYKQECKYTDGWILSFKKRR